VAGRGTGPRQKSAGWLSGDPAFLFSGTAVIAAVFKVAMQTGIAYRALRRCGG